MKEVNEDAWAAVRRVLAWQRPTLTASEANDLTTVLSLLPEALTNPQPALPTEPGLYLASNRVVLELEDGQWTLPGMSTVDNPSGHGLPFTRLVPERPQVTRDQILDLLSSTIGTPNGLRADKILALVNGTRA